MLYIISSIIEVSITYFTRHACIEMIRDEVYTNFP